jgi:signal peptidase I
MNPRFFRVACAAAAVLLLLSCNDDQRALISGLRPFRVPTKGMEPAVHVGEHVFSRSYGRSERPSRFDVVVFKYPLHPGETFLKRIIGLPGETVGIRHKVVYVNGAPFADRYGTHRDPLVYDQPNLPEPYKSRDNFGPLHLGVDEYFVLGDDRDSSTDSRYWGVLPRRLIEGKAVKAGPLGGPLRNLR